MLQLAQYQANLQYQYDALNASLMKNTSGYSGSGRGSKNSLGSLLGGALNGNNPSGDSSQPIAGYNRKSNSATISKPVRGTSSANSVVKLNQLR